MSAITNLISSAVEYASQARAKMSAVRSAFSSAVEYVSSACDKAAVDRLTSAQAASMPEIVAKGLLTFVRPSIERGSYGEMFMHVLAQQGNAKILKLFLEKLPEQERLSVVNALDKRGNTPLAFSSYFGTEECLQLLLNAKADPLIFNHEGDFVYTLATQNGHKSIAQILAEREPKLKGAFALVKLMNAFGLEPSPSLAGKKVPPPGPYANFEQGNVAESLKEPLVRKKILSHCNQEQYEELLQAFNTASLENPPLKEIVQKIREGKLVIFLAGWKEHAIALVFRDGYLVICNRGQGCDDEQGNPRTFYAHKISLEQVTVELLKKCLDQADAPAEEARKVIYGELLQALKAEQDGFCKKIQAVSPKPIYADICAYAAGKSALRTALALLTKDPEMARDASKAWATKQREAALEAFRKAPSPFDEPFSKETFDAQAKRLEQRKKTLLVKHLYRLKEGILQKQPFASRLQDFQNFFGLKQRKKLEECLRIVCKKKKMKTPSHFLKVSSPLFGRKMFLHRKFSRALKQQAIDLFIEQIDPDKAIRTKL